jgi:hypothetical protein
MPEDSLSGKLKTHSRIYDISGKHVGRPAPTLFKHDNVFYRVSDQPPICITRQADLRQK